MLLEIFEKKMLQNHPWDISAAYLNRVTLKLELKRKLYEKEAIIETIIVQR